MPLLELYGKKPDGAIDKRVIAGMTGWIIFFPTDAPPDGTLVCNGGAVSRTAYAELFAVLGTKYGAGDGSTTFNLPDLRGRFVRGTGGNAAALGVQQGQGTALNGQYLIMQRAISKPPVGIDIPIPYVNGGNNTFPYNASGDSSLFCYGYDAEGNPLSGSGTALPEGGHYIKSNSDVWRSDDPETRPINVALLPCIIYE